MGAWVQQTFISRASPLYPKSSATSIAHFSPIKRAVESIRRINTNLSISNKDGLTCIAPHIVRANGKISDLEVLDAVDIKALIKDTMLDDAVSLFRRHGASLHLISNCAVIKIERLTPRLCHVVSTCLFTHSSTCAMSSLLYFRSSYTLCELLFNKLGFDGRPESTGIDQDPCWIPAVRLPGSA
jgi:hypothetical protein